MLFAWSTWSRREGGCQACLAVEGTMCRNNAQATSQLTTQLLAFPPAYLQKILGHSLAPIGAFEKAISTAGVSHIHTQVGQFSNTLAKMPPPQSIFLLCIHLFRSNNSVIDSSDFTRCDLEQQHLVCSQHSLVASCAAAHNHVQLHIRTCPLSQKTHFISFNLLP